MFPLSYIILYAGVSSAAVSITLSMWKWSRQRYRFITSSLATFLGFAVWNILQSDTGADQVLNIDWPLFPLSWSDVGSGVAAFVLTAMTLGFLTDREQPAWRVMLAAGVAGVLASSVDLFVL